MKSTGFWNLQSAWVSKIRDINALLLKYLCHCLCPPCFHVKYIIKQTSLRTYNKCMKISKWLWIHFNDKRTIISLLSGRQNKNDIYVFNCWPSRPTLISNGFRLLFKWPQSTPLSRSLKPNLLHFSNFFSYLDLFNCIWST